MIQYNITLCDTMYYSLAITLWKTCYPNTNVFIQPAVCNITGNSWQNWNLLLQSW